MQADLLIGAGAVASLETSAVSLGEAGAAPRFVAGVRARAFILRDSTCPAIYAGLLASQKGVPFMPIAGIIGSDLLAVRPDWKVIDSPVGAQRKVVVVPAIAPDIALFHAPEADRAGNIRIGRHRELANMAYAAQRSFVTVERIVDHNLLDTEDSAAGVLPSLYVEAIACRQTRRLAAAPVGRISGRLGRSRTLCHDGALRGRLPRLSLRLSRPTPAGGLMSTERDRRELLIATIADLLDGVRHVAVGASSPMPAAGADAAPRPQ